MNRWMKCYCLPILLAGLVAPVAWAQSQPVEIIAIDPPNPAVGQTVTVRLQLLFVCWTSPALNPEGEDYDFNIVDGELIMDVVQRLPEVIIGCPGPIPHEYEVQFTAPGPSAVPLKVYWVPEDTLFPIQPEDRPDGFAETEILFGAPQAVPIPTLGLAGLLALALFTLLVAGWALRKESLIVG